MPHCPPKDLPLLEQKNAARGYRTFLENINNTIVLQYPQWNHYVTNGTLVNNNNKNMLILYCLANK